MDIYYPPGKDTLEAKTIILVHGSGPSSSYKDTAAYQSWGRLLAVKGFNAITFNWRPGESPEDVGDLITFVRKNHERLRISGDRLNIIAFSAGVKESIPEVLKANEGFVQSISIYYGELDDSILGSELEQRLPENIFIAMAASDYYVNPECNEDFVAAARDRGFQVIYLIHKSGRHGFDVYTDNQETRDIIDRTISFIGGID
ncbi:MAG: hypothetical protein UMV23_02035 [Halanaerobium sp.]|nr:hypothetical protein [Halanaerobium sp.]